MLRRTLFLLTCAAGLWALAAAERASAQQFGPQPMMMSQGMSMGGPQAIGPSQAFGRTWGGTYSTQDWDRLYHYPYVYYPQNFYSNEYFQSSNDLYFRYPPEMRVPVYNKQWHNMYPEGQLYHRGHHFILDTF